MALGNYIKTTYVDGSAPGISAARLNNNEDKTAELDTQTAAYLADNAKKISFAPVADAITSPTAAILSGGSVDTGTHNYLVTFVTADGETGFTALSPTPTIAVTTAGNNTVNLTSIPLGATETTARKIYRMSSLQPLRYYVLLTTIANNITTVYVDTASDASLPATGMQSKWNTTAGKLYVGSVLAGYIGESNTLLGMRGLEQLTTGFDNTGMGMGVFSAMTSGYNNSAFGVNALWGNTTGINNTGIGVHALQNNSSGSNNTAIGVYALECNTSGYNNIAIGCGSLLDNTTGFGCIAIGIDALANNTTAYDNIAIGLYALRDTTTGVSNIVVGNYSMKLNTIGYNNTVVGYDTLSKNITGHGNVAFGANTLMENVGGYNNTAIGLSALQGNTEGISNVAIGVNALIANTTATGNVAVGFSAGYTITTGIDNTFIGNNAGNTATATFYRTTAIGSGAQVTASDTMQLGDVNLTNVATHGDFETQDIADGFICKAPDGTRKRITVSNANVIVITAL